MNSKHFCRTSLGRMELCVPSNSSSSFRPVKAAQSCSAWCEGTRVSDSPWMKQICLPNGSCLRRVVTSMRSMASPARLSTLHWMQAKTQGKRQWKRQQQARGRNFALDSLQRTDRLEQAESATIRSHCSLISRLTAPMLRPHPTTRCPWAFRKAAAVSTSLASSCPSVMKSPSVRLPQPLKSKQASPTLSGRQLRNSVPSKQEEPLPCRQRTTQSMFFCRQKVTSKGTISVSAVKRWAARLGGRRISGLQTKRGGRMSMKASCSRSPSCGYCRISQVCGRTAALLSSGCSPFLSSWLERFIACTHSNILQFEQRSWKDCPIMQNQQRVQEQSMNH